MLSIIGIGNNLRGDDGIGPKIIEILADKDFLFPVRIIDAGSDAFTILNELLESNQVLLIDCAHMGLKPGSVKLFTIDSIKKFANRFGVSLHGFSLAEVWEMVKAMDRNCQLKIIGVEPSQVAFNSELSDEVKKSIPTIITIVSEEARKYAEENTDH